VKNSEEPSLKTRYSYKIFGMRYRTLYYSVKRRLHMTIGLQTGRHTGCDDRFANRSSCVNSQIHGLQTGRHTGRKKQNRTQSSPSRRLCKLRSGMSSRDFADVIQRSVFEEWSLRDWSADINGIIRGCCCCCWCAVITVKLRASWLQSPWRCLCVNTTSTTVTSKTKCMV